MYVESGCMSECEYACVHVNYVSVYGSMRECACECGYVWVYIYMCIESAECVNELNAYGSVLEHGMQVCVHVSVSM